MQLLDRLDAWMYVQEKRAVAAMLAVMGLVVFLDVLHGVSGVNSPLVPDGVEAAIGAAAVPVWGGLAAFVLTVLGLLTRGGRQVLPKALGVGLGFGVFLAGFARLPSVSWSLPVALALTLWVGMLGACLAAYQRRHLALDVGSKLWPAHIAPKAAAIGHFVTALFCLLLVVLGVRSIFGVGSGDTHIPGHLDDWLASEGFGGNVTGTRIPKWLVMVAIPFGSLVLAFRFALEGVKVWSGWQALEGDDTLRMLGLEDEVKP